MRVLCFVWTARNGGFSLEEHVPGGTISPSIAGRLSRSGVLLVKLAEHKIGSEGGGCGIRAEWEKRNDDFLSVED